MRAEARTPRPKSRSPLGVAVFSYVHNLVLENEQVGYTFARQPYHVLIVIFNPPADGLPIHQFDAHLLLLLSESFEEASLLESLFRRWRPPALSGIRTSLRTEGHTGIVHKRTPEAAPSCSLPERHAPKDNASATISEENSGASVE